MRLDGPSCLGLDTDAGFSQEASGFPSPEPTIFTGE